MEEKEEAGGEGRSSPETWPKPTPTTLQFLSQHLHRRKLTGKRGRYSEFVLTVGRCSGMKGVVGFGSGWRLF